MKVIIARMKLFFHCLFKFHRSLTTWDSDDKVIFLGCYDCGYESLNRVMVNK